MPAASIERTELEATVRRALKRSPVAALLGPRQCGKTTLSRRLAVERGAEFFDAESPAGRRRLEQPVSALEPLRGLVVLDEAQLRSEVFPVLRVLADREPLPARFLLPGSASPDLVKGVSESLAGRVAFVDMGGFDLGEVGEAAQRRLWLRGGFPRSFLPEDDRASFAWREDFIRTFLERDIRAGQDVEMTLHGDCRTLCLAPVFALLAFVRGPSSSLPRFLERTLAAGGLRNRIIHSMQAPESPSLRARPSLVAGIQAGDEDRWHEFFRLYGPAIRGFALKAGLTETEADEVVQETCIGVARNVAEYRYEPARCRFKTWLLNLASWRVKNQYAKRKRWEERRPRTKEDEEREMSSVLEFDFLGHADTDDLGALWDAEWRNHLLQAALANVRTDFSAMQFQIFDLNVLKEWPVREVAKSLGVSMASVYLAKHRVSVALKHEMVRLERRLEAQVAPPLSEADPA